MQNSKKAKRKLTKEKSIEKQLKHYLYKFANFLIALNDI